MRGFKYPSRNRKVADDRGIACPYCGNRYSDENESDYYMYENTKINYCRNEKCGLEFINGITKTLNTNTTKIKGAVNYEKHNKGLFRFIYGRRTRNRY